MCSLAKDIGIDLGTASVLIYIKDKGIVLNEPSVVAIDKDTGKLLKVGADAQAMLGRTPGNIVAIRPLREGVISDYEVTERMLKELIHKVMGFQFFKPRIIICVPSGITEVEERAVIQATMEAGARRVYLMEEPLAAALGCLNRLLMQADMPLPALRGRLQGKEEAALCAVLQLTGRKALQARWRREAADALRSLDAARAEALRQQVAHLQFF